MPNQRNYSVSIEKKFGLDITEHGWTAVPNILLEHQSRLGLGSSEVLLLINILRYWKGKSSNQLPFPGSKKLASCMGVQQRQIRKILQKLEEHQVDIGTTRVIGLIKRKPRFKNGAKGQKSNSYCLDRLIVVLLLLCYEKKELSSRRGKNYVARAKNPKIISDEEIRELLRSIP